MTEQEIFEFTARHLFAQDKRAEARTFDCVYWDPRTHMSCAVGCHLSPEAQKTIKTTRASLTLLKIILSDAGCQKDVEFIKLHEPMLRALQRCHDEPTHWKTSKIMRLALNNVADRYNLKRLPNTSEFFFKDR